VKSEKGISMVTNQSLQT